MSATSVVDAAHELVRQRYTVAGADPLHALRVGGLVADAEPQPWLIAAGVLHDILEDTATRADELDRLFEPRIATAVKTLTDPEGPMSFQMRKRLLRDQIATADWGIALVFSADKLDRLRELQNTPAPLPPQGRAHYAASVTLIQQRLPPLPWNRELAQLARTVLHRPST